VNPARRRSFVVLEELTGRVSLEDLAADWRAAPPPVAEKRRLIAAVAALTRRMHASGVNHRDYYLCHILKDADGEGLCLLDLHRAQIRRRVPRRWRLKDLSGLYFSAMEAGLTRRDRLRFVAGYAGAPWRRALAADPAFWAAVERKAVRLRRRHRGGEDG
jgi:heptose I phosphotransferase